SRRRHTRSYGDWSSDVCSSDLIDSYAPEYIIVLASDHIYKMDYERMLVQHVNSGANVTVACLEVPVAEASGFGVIHADAAGRIEIGRASCRERVESTEVAGAGK